MAARRAPSIPGPWKCPRKRPRGAAGPAPPVPPRLPGMPGLLPLPQPAPPPAPGTAELYRLLVENVTNYAIVMLDPEGRVSSWNEGAERILGFREAEALGAMALFGEKYGAWVRVIEVDEISRELCGGTHVANTAEVGIFAIASEGSSAANVRRVEALTGPAAIDWFRERSSALEEAGALLGSARDPLTAARRAAERLAALERLKEELDARQAKEQADQLGDGGRATVARLQVPLVLEPLLRGQGPEHVRRIPFCVAVVAHRVTPRSCSASRRARSP